MCLGWDASLRMAAPLCVVGEVGRGQTLCGLSVEGNCWQLRRDLLFGKINLGWTFLGDYAFLARDGGVSGNGEKRVSLGMLRNGAWQGSTGCGNKIPNLWQEQEPFINVRM